MLWFLETLHSSFATGCFNHVVDIRRKEYKRSLQRKFKKKISSRVDRLAIPIEAYLLSLQLVTTLGGLLLTLAPRRSVFPLSPPEKIRKCHKVHENLSLKFRKLKTTQTLKHSVWFESWTKVCYVASGVIPV